MMRVLSALLLSLVLALTSHSAGMAKGAPMAVDQMVICTGLGATVIYMDAEGQPTVAPHNCPDCLVHLDDIDLLDVGPEPALLRAPVLTRPASSHLALSAQSVQTPPARAPPALI